MAVSKVILNGTTLIDVTDDTVTPSTLIYGSTATMANGVETTGIWGIEITISSSGAVTQALDPGKIYHFTGALTSLTITLNAASDSLAQYHFDFSSGSPALTLVLPNTVKLPSSFTVAADKHYEFNILNDYATTVEWAARLPNEYKEVEYIESTSAIDDTSGPCIDTGFLPNQNTRLYLLASGYAWQVQTREALLTNEFGIRYTASNWVRYIYGNAQKYVTNNSFDFTAITEVDANKSSATVKNNNWITTLSPTANTFSCPQSLLLFALRSDTSTVNYCPGKLYSCKLWDNDVLVHDFVPCYRVSDGEIGMFDLVANQFYGNAGTSGSVFLKGGDL